MVNCSNCGYNNMSRALKCASCGEDIPVVVKRVSAKLDAREVDMLGKMVAPYPAEQVLTVSLNVGSNSFAAIHALEE